MAGSLSSFRGQKDRLHVKNSTAMSLYRSHDHLLKINHRPYWKQLHIKYSMLTKSQLSRSCQPFWFSWERLFFTLPCPIFLPGSHFSEISDNFSPLFSPFNYHNQFLAVKMWSLLYCCASSSSVNKRWTEKWRRDRLFKQISDALERGILVSHIRFERRETVKSMSEPIKRLTKQSIHYLIVTIMQETQSLNLTFLGHQIQVWI